ncbi:MAG: LON peptidase substrate-binding domain-containing protein [Myxococcota bacterium]|nr:LON peptidase substrate-binding domain-containing protein [Myxococcota bacterium]
MSHSPKINDRVTVTFEELPVFPLSGVTLFPKLVLPLHIFELRYQALLQHCLERDRRFAVAQPTFDGDLRGVGMRSPLLRPICVIGRVVATQPLAEGRWNILLQGEERVELINERVREGQLYRSFSARPYPDLPSEPAQHGLLEGKLRELLGVLERQGGESSERAALLLEGGEELDLLCALTSAHLVTEPDVRQALLEVDRLDDRAEMLIDHLTQQLLLSFSGDEEAEVH